MNSLKEIGINPKLYRSWFHINKNTRIRVNTAFGMTEFADEGSAGGSLASQANIDRGLDSYFRGSSDEISYGRVRLQPLSFQDDIARMAGYVKSAQTGNTKIDSIMNKNLLKVHPDKTGFIVMGCKKYKEKVYTELKENPIMFGKFVTKEKEVDKYLGDLMHIAMD